MAGHLGLPPGPVEARGRQGLCFRPRRQLRLFGATRCDGIRSRGRPFRPAEATPTSLAPRPAPSTPCSSTRAGFATIRRPVRRAVENAPRRPVFGFPKATAPLPGNRSENPSRRPGRSTSPAASTASAAEMPTTFDCVPDVPVPKFVPDLSGAKHGPLVASTSLCAEPAPGDRPAQSAAWQDRQLALEVAGAVQRK